MKVLAIGDPHAPVTHPAYMPFCRDLRDRYRCNSILFIGDMIDHHAISFHARHPDAPGPKDEYELASTAIKQWAKTFPKANVCIGNHDERVIRVAAEAGIPARYIRDYAETWGTPGWKWDYEFLLDDVHYRHGTGNGGIHPAFNAATKMGMSVVMGHIHSAGGVKWRANPVRRWFGLDTGCGIDDRAYAFAYGKHQITRSILSAAVVEDGIPQHFIMPCGPGEKYHKSKFKRAA